MFTTSRISSLPQAAAQENLAKVKQLIEVDAADPNVLDEKTQMRPIFFAAIRCHREIFDYLLSKGAHVSCNGNYHLQNNLLYCICADKNKSASYRAQLLTWLLEDNNYEKLDVGIQKEHIAAALGQPPQDGYLGERDKSGFLPCHYAAMVGNQNLLAWCSETGELEENGQQSQGITVSWLLAVNNSYALLEDYAERCQTIDFNSTPFSDIDLCIITQHCNIDKYHGFWTFRDKKTLAWLSAILNTDFLKRYLGEHPGTWIDFTVYLKKNTESLLTRFLNEKEHELLEMILQPYDEKALEKLASAILDNKDFSDHSDRFVFPYDYILIRLVKKCYQNLCQNLRFQTLENNGEKESEGSFVDESEIGINKETTQNYFNKIFQLLHSIQPESLYYPQAQFMIGNIIFSYIHEQNLHPILWNALESRMETAISQPTSIEHQLWLYMIICFNRGDKQSQEKAIQLRIELYANLEKLENKNEQLKKKIQSLKGKQTAESSDDVDALTSQLGKTTLEEQSQEKGTDESSDVDIAAFTSQFGMVTSEEQSPVEAFDLSSKFLKLLEESDLEAIKRLIEEEQFDPLIKLTELQITPINMMAMDGNLEIIQYLFAIKAFQSGVERPFDNFLFASCICELEDERLEILQWLLEDNHYEQFGLGIQKEHIAAALSQLPQGGFLGGRDNSGFLPCHYAAMVGNKNVLEWCSETGELEEDAQLSYGCTVSLLLAQTGQFELLEKYLQKFREAINPKANFFDTTVLLLLASVQQWKLFDTYAQLHPEKIDWDATCLFGPLQGIDVFWLLAFYRQWELFDKYTAYAKTINWNAAPVQSFRAPQNIQKEYKRSENEAGDDREKVKAEKIDKKIRLNDFSWSNYEEPESDTQPFSTGIFTPSDYKRVTLAWLLIDSQRGNFILEKLKSEPDARIDLEAGPIDEKIQGVKETSFDTVLNKVIDSYNDRLLSVCLMRDKDYMNLEFLLSKRSSSFDHSPMWSHLVRHNHYNSIILIIQELEEKEVHELKAYCEEEPEEELIELWQKNTMIDACQLVLAIKRHEKLSQDIVAPASLEESEKGKEKTSAVREQTILSALDIKYHLKKIFEYLYSIEKDSPYYLQAQLQVGHIIFSYLQVPTIIPLLKEVLANKVEEKYIFSELMAIEYQLRLYMEICFNRSNHFNQSNEEGKFLILQLIAEMLKNYEELEQEYKQLKKDLSELDGRIRPNTRLSIRNCGSIPFWQAEQLPTVAPVLAETPNQLELIENSFLNNS
jgi:ankyrin repeat protein